MSKERKKFKDSAVGKFLKNNVPDLLDVADDFFPPIGILTAAVKGKNLSPELQSEFDKLALDYEQNERRDYLADVQNARSREVELAKAGGHDHLMYVAGYVALLSFLVLIGAVIFMPEAVADNSLFHQLMGIVEGVALTVFGYYFGTSKSSRDKDFQRK